MVGGATTGVEQARQWHAHCSIGLHDWLNSLGDASALAWITTSAYLGTALLSYAAIKSARVSDKPEPEYRIFWGLTALAFAFLGVNKQLDFQTLLTTASRCVALASGWYDDRRYLQHLFVIGLYLTGGVLAAVACLYFRRIVCLVGLAVTGIALVVLFVIISAASFQHEEQWSSIALPDAASAHIIELIGIALVAINCAVVSRRKSEKERRCCSRRALR
jgi:hypothetical protein